MKTCSYCSLENPDDQTQCITCHTALDAPSSARRELMIQFQSQSFALAIFHLVCQTIIALFVSWLHGYYWYWIIPLCQLLVLPRVNKQSWVIIDEAGVKEGDRIHVLWTEIESLAKRGWTRAVFNMRDGRRKSLSTFDWPAEKRDQFYEFLEHKISMGCRL